MTFVHQDREFADLIRTTASEGPITSEAMVEKDYWICHTLWALENSGLEFYFKGGTSLSKGFGLLPRFSEDIDLVVLNGRLDLPDVSSWRTEGAAATRARRAYWDRLIEQVVVPDAELELDPVGDGTERNVGVRVHYSVHVEAFRAVGALNRPWVLLEMSHGSVSQTARAPAVVCPIGSQIHTRLEILDLRDRYTDNRPKGVACVHPLVTLLEKLDSITRRYEREVFEPHSFVRHYEDAARIIRRESELAPVACPVHELAAEMLHRNQIRRSFQPDEPALVLDDSIRRAAVERAYAELNPMYWSDRIPFHEALDEIVGWVARQDFGRGPRPS